MCVVERAARFITITDGVFQQRDWNGVLNSRRLSYTGEVVKKLEYLTWAQVSAGLPPRELCGKIEATDLAIGPVRTFLQRPNNWVQKLQSLRERPKPGKMFHMQGEEVALAQGLVKHNTYLDLCQDQEYPNLVTSENKGESFTMKLVFDGSQAQRQH